MKMGAPLLTTEMSGSVGGLTASKARGGVRYFRSRVRPSNPRSSAQSTMRLILASLASAWSNVLGDSDRATWNAIAQPSESGIDVYTKINSQLELGGSGRKDQPQGSGVHTVSQLTAIGIDASTHLLSFTNTDFDDDDYVNIFIEVQKQKSSRLARQFPYRYAHTTNLNAAAPNTFDLNGFFPAGYLVAGDVVYVRFVQYNANGAVAVPQEQRIIVVA